jgi:hypothetical protein
MRIVRAAVLAGIVTVSFCQADARTGAEPGLSKVGLGAVTGFFPLIGADVKFWPTTHLAIDGSLGYYQGFQIQANVTYNREFIKRFPVGHLPFYAGGGLFTDLARDFDFGFQAIVGAEWFMKWAPVSVFAHFVPNVEVADDPHFAFRFAFGGRYYF